jgi:hypothetical protein
MEDGSCRCFLSDECIAALKTKASNNYLVRNSVKESYSKFGSIVSCSCFASPPECGGAGPRNKTEPYPALSGMPTPYLNGSVIEMGNWSSEKEGSREGAYA